MSRLGDLGRALLGIEKQGTRVVGGREFQVARRNDPVYYPRIGCRFADETAAEWHAGDRQPCRVSCGNGYCGVVCEYDENGLVGIRGMCNKRKFGLQEAGDTAVVLAANSAGAVFRAAKPYVAEAAEKFVVGIMGGYEEVIRAEADEIITAVADAAGIGRVPLEVRREIRREIVEEVLPQEKRKWWEIF